LTYIQLSVDLPCPPFEFSHPHTPIGCYAQTLYHQDRACHYKADIVVIIQTKEHRSQTHGYKEAKFHVFYNFVSLLLLLGSLFEQRIVHFLMVLAVLIYIEA
jgi:hypothetical protein